MLKKLLPKPVYNILKRMYFYRLFLSDYFTFKKKSSDGRFEVNWRDRKPCLYDKTLVTNFDRHYIYHPAWAARIVKKIAPPFHVDISSTLNFSTMLSAFIPVRFYDYRPADLKLHNLQSNRVDLLNLPFKDNSVTSLSCMHTVEHVGLGRYGDPIDPDGDLKAIQEMIRVLAPGGSLIFVVPVGKPIIAYNAHRIYSYEQILEYFKGLSLVETYLIPNTSGDPLTNPPKERFDQETYGCGCFWFKK